MDFYRTWECEFTEIGAINPESVVTTRTPRQINALRADFLFLT
jgi:hypothetical protein